MALSAQRELRHLVESELLSYKCGASVVIWKGGFVGIDPAGYLKPFVPGDRFKGIAYEDISAATATTTAGTASVRVWTGGNRFVLPFTGVVQGNVGKPVFATDDETLSLTGHPDAFVGRIFGIDATNYALVQLRSPLESLRDGEVSGVFDLTWSGMRAFAAFAKASTGQLHVPGWAMHGVAAVGAPGITYDKTVGEHILLLASTDEAENLTIESPFVFNVTKGITLDFVGRNSAAGNATDELTIGLAALSTTGLTATERADMVAATAGYKRILYHIVTNALDILAGSDDDATVVAPVDTLANNILATNTYFKLIVRPTGVCELWHGAAAGSALARYLSTTSFLCGTTGIFGAVVNLEKSAGTGVPAARIKNLRVAGALA